MTRPARRSAPESAPDALLAWMAALADPTRLRLLRVLERRELSVLEVCEVLALPQSTVSRHLKVLSDVGWLESRPEGTQRRWRWAAGIDPGARKLWSVTRAESETWPVVREDAVRLQAVRARRDESQRFFAGAAGAWDELRARVYGRALGHEALLALLPSSWTVADLGCGTGAVAAELAPRVRRVLAVDQSAAMLRAARRRTDGLANVELHEAELAQLPIDTGRCDAALLVLVLAYLEDPAPALREGVRILRPGGRLAVLDAARHEDEPLRRRMGQAVPGFEPGALAALLGDAGLGHVTARTLPPEAGARGPGLVVCSGEKPARSLRPRPPPP